MTTTTDQALNELSAGSKINNEATVIACHKIRERVVGDTLATWVALCVKSADDYHPYVVWTVVARPEGFSAGNGEYAFTLAEGIEFYEKRGGKP
jgi:hypothetical protein